MNLNGVKSVVTSKMGRQILKLRKESPTLLFVAGVAGVVGATVLACRATLKLDDILAEMEETLDKVEAFEAPSYSTQDRNRDMLIIRARAIGKIAKVYSPAIIIGGLSVASLTGSHVTLKRRNLGLMAAYAALEKGFDEYRERVKKELGTDKDLEFHYDLQDVEVAEETPKGTTKKSTQKRIGPNRASIYAVCFDESNPNWQPTDHYNQFYIQANQGYANDLLQSRGHVFLNDVYDMMGFPRTSAGAVVGWVKGNGDNYIDFGVFEGDRESGMRFVRGEEHSIWLDFNVDGVIYDKI